MFTTFDLSPLRRTHGGRRGAGPVMRADWHDDPVVQTGGLVAPDHRDQAGHRA